MEELDETSVGLVADFWHKSKHTVVGVVMDKQGVLYGENTLREGWDAKPEIDPTDPFFSFSGMLNAVGVGYIAGTLGGAIAGSYNGLTQRSAGTALTWRSAGLSLFHYGTTRATAYGNRVAAAAFVVCLTEGFLREAVLRQGREKYQFRKVPEEADLLFFERDSRKITPFASLIAIPALRHRSNMRTIVASTVLFALASSCYSHIWAPEKYFDIRKGWEVTEPDTA
eukprot:TRINITY_DN16047_c0_g2_i1.p1 TRINITY_DN16047_c0_g2~~TRINITY_DN16047_c0_g2_i1.p1  ORF type:complete len:226 (+),score=24.37 TRINITY_DN16047_c0_g2_i1:66-743(+)